MDYFQERLNELNELCCDRIDDLLIRLGVEYKRIGRRIVGCCPLHNSDNNSGWNLYDSGNSRRGNYVCYSAQCEKKFGNNIIGLTRGILTRKSRGDISFNTSVLYLCEFLGYKSLQEIPLPDKQTLKLQKDFIKTNLKQFRLKIASSKSSDHAWLRAPCRTWNPWSPSVA